MTSAFFLPDAHCLSQGKYATIAPNHPGKGKAVFDMKDFMLGASATAKTVVNEGNTAKAMGSGNLAVFATPAMIALMEEAATRCAAQFLDEGSETVGTMISVKHMSATPVSMEVCAKATLTEVDGKRLVFDVVAEDEAGIIGAGTHERFIVSGEKFLLRTQGKLSAKEGNQRR